ncbi:hypothetical protein [Aureivirga sp. CE67]|uniref:hypothetical protein n=1 Tax=Aureivirga sp. CE67 TaxID=1788983 RepID=UPI0018CA86B3|nr:hypothetical protein [Aureivirga sp. CE67]
MKKIYFILILLVFPMKNFAQKNDIYEKTKDLNTTINTIYSVISGEKGKKRDWNLFLNLFHENAYLIQNVPTKSGKDSLVYIKPQQFVETSRKWMEENGFFENEIHRTTNVFGSNAQVFTSYEIKMTKNQVKPSVRGINNIQLYFDGKRWWVLSIFWTRETPNNPIPEKYLGK